MWCPAEAQHCCACSEVCSKRPQSSLKMKDFGFCFMGYTWQRSGLHPSSELKNLSWRGSGDYVVLWIESRTAVVHKASTLFAMISPVARPMTLSSWWFTRRQMGLKA